jgi:hypothetical protein
LSLRFLGFSRGARAANPTKQGGFFRAGRRPARFDPKHGLDVTPPTFFARGASILRGFRSRRNKNISDLQRFGIDMIELRVVPTFRTRRPRIGPPRFIGLRPRAVRRPAVVGRRLVVRLRRQSRSWAQFQSVISLGDRSTVAATKAATMRLRSAGVRRQTSQRAQMPRAPSETGNPVFAAKASPRRGSWSAGVEPWE